MPEEFQRTISNYAYLISKLFSTMKNITIPRKKVKRNQMNDLRLLSTILWEYYPIDKHFESLQLPSVKRSGSYSGGECPVFLPFQGTLGKRAVEKSN